MMSSAMDGSEALKGGSEQPSETFEPISGAVSEFVAARRLGLSVDTLRRDRRLGQLGIPFVKYGTGKCGAVRYDLADLERFIESRKKRAMPVVETQAPTAPVAAMPVEQLEEPEEIEPPMPTRRPPPRTPWEAMAERYADEPEDDPFAQGGRALRRRGPSGYFSG